MRVADNIEMLSLPTSSAGEVHPTLLWDDQNVILVDTGFPGQLPALKEAMGQAGVPFNRLNKIILTHHDLDHIGGLRAILNEIHPAPVVYAHRIEQPYIDGTSTPLKLAHMESNFAALPAEQQAFFQQFKQGFQNSFAPVDQSLEDGEVLPFCGGIRVVFTPGHTLGHISLLHLPSRILIAGDLLNCSPGDLAIPASRMNHDDAQLKASLKKLLPLEISGVICYHGGFFTGDVAPRLSSLSGV